MSDRLSAQQASLAASQIASEPTVWGSDEAKAALASFHQRRVASEIQRRRARVAWGGLLAAAAAFTLWSFVSLDPGEVGDTQELSEAAPLRVKASEETASGPEALVQQDDGARGRGVVRFLDGSSARLIKDDSELVLRQAEQGGVAVELVTGAAEFEVEAKPEQSFLVIAAGVSVRVIGTAFTVSHGKGRVHVAVTRGHVEVTAAGEARKLSAGEASWFVGQLEREAMARDAQPARSRSGHAEARKGEASTAGSEGPSEFIRYHQEAQYQEAYRLLKQAPKALGSGDEHWMRAADAARYSGHPGEAVRYLKRVSETGGQGSTAAFILGRLFHYELGQPGVAAKHYARAQRLAPSGPMAESALFREVECRSQAGDAGGAARLAERFLKQYPSSSRRSQVAGYVLKP